MWGSNGQVTGRKQSPWRQSCLTQHPVTFSGPQPPLRRGISSLRYYSRPFMVQFPASFMPYLLLMLRGHVHVQPMCPRAFAPVVPSPGSILSHSFSYTSLIILSPCESLLILPPEGAIKHFPRALSCVSDCPTPLLHSQSSASGWTQATSSVRNIGLRDRSEKHH